MFGKSLNEVTTHDIELAAAAFFTPVSSSLLPEHLPILKPTALVPVFDSTGTQMTNVDGTLKVLPYGHVAAANFVDHMQRGIICDPATTMSSNVADHSLLLGAVDVFAITNDGYLLMGVRSQFQNAASVAPLKTFDSASGFRGLIKGTSTAESPQQTAHKELSQELGIIIPPDQFEPVHHGINLQRLLHYPEITLPTGRVITGYRPTFSNAFVTYLPFGLRAIQREVTLSSEHDGVVAVPFMNADALRILSGSVSSVCAHLYRSDRLTNYNDESPRLIGDIYANARLKSTFDKQVRAELLTPIEITLTSSDCSINGSMASGTAKARLLSNYFRLPIYR